MERQITKIEYILYFSIGIILGVFFSLKISHAISGTGGYTEFPYSDGKAPTYTEKENSILSKDDPNSSDYWSMVQDPFPQNTFPYVSNYPQNATTSYGTVNNGSTTIFNASSSNTNATVYYFSFTWLGVPGGFGAPLLCGSNTIFAPANSNLVSHGSQAPVVIRCPAGQNLSITNGSGVGVNYILIWGNPWYDQVTSSLPVALNTSSTNPVTSPEMVYMVVAIITLCIISFFDFGRRYFTKTFKK